MNRSVSRRCNMIIYRDSESSCPVLQQDSKSTLRAATTHRIRDVRVGAMYVAVGVTVKCFPAWLVTSCCNTCTVQRELWYFLVASFMLDTIYRNQPAVYVKLLWQGGVEPLGFRSSPCRCLETPAIGDRSDIMRTKKVGWGVSSFDREVVSDPR